MGECSRLTQVTPCNPTAAPPPALGNQGREVSAHAHDDGFRDADPSRPGDEAPPEVVEQSLRRVAALVPPPRANLVRYFGVFAPNARGRLRPGETGRGGAPGRPAMTW
jgi:hypothetical protein